MHGSVKKLRPLLALAVAATVAGTASPAASVSSATASVGSGGSHVGEVQGLSSLSGHVFFDRDGDGVKDPAEGPIPDGLFNVCVQSTVASGCSQPVHGAWQVTDLPPGEYDIHLGAFESGWTQTLPAAGTDRHVTITTNGDAIAVGDFGTDARVGEVRGIAWDDQNGDGVHDPGEPGLADVQVCLNASGHEGTSCQVTASDGSYSFPAAPAGTVRIIPNSPEGWTRTAPEGTISITVVEDGSQGVDLGFAIGGAPQDFFPGVPGSVSTTPGDRSASLAWTAPPAIAEAPVVDYLVQVSTSAAGPWTDVAHPAGTTTRLVLTRLVNGRRTYARVASVGPFGPGGWSQIVSAVPRGAPGAPRSPVARPRSRKVVLTWALPSTNNGAPITDYVIQRRNRRTGAWIRVADSVSTGRRIVVKATSGRRVWFRIAAKNTAGQGAWSKVVRSVPR